MRVRSRSTKQEQVFVVLLFAAPAPDSHPSSFIGPLDSLGNLPLLSAPDNLGEIPFTSDC